MPNPYDELQTAVATLQSRHDELLKAMPALEENKKVAANDLSNLNQLVSKAQEQLENLKTEIEQHTEAYNVWQRGEIAKLDAAKKDLASDRKKLEDDMVEKAASITSHFNAIEQSQLDIDKAKVALDARQKDINEQVRANDRVAENLKGMTEKHEGERQELINMGKTAGVRAKELHERELKLADDLKEAAEVVKASERERKTARTLLEGSKEKLANMDARDQAQDLRDKQLNNKEASLNKKEAALNDRISTIASH